MNKKLFIIFICLTIFNCVFAYNQVFAQGSQPDLKEQVSENLTQSGTKAGYGAIQGQTANDIAWVIGRIIQYILGFIGVIFLIIIIYSGFQWMTAGGNEETVTKAKKRIVNSVIGLVIIFTAYLITYFITNVLIETTNYAV